MLRLTLALVVIAYLPGAVGVRLPGRSRAYRDALPVAERTFWAVLLSVIWSVLVVLLLGAVGQYSFDRLLIVNGAVSATGIALGAWRRPRTAPNRQLTSLALPLVIIAIGYWLYFPASEYIIGGKDPGTYVNAGIQIAQRGHVIARDETVAEVPPPLRDLFFPSHQRTDYYGLRFMGFFIQDPADGSVVAQFPHFYPASIAIGYGLDGLTGARNTIGLWAILGLLAVYFAGAEVVGRPAAAAAALLLSVNVVTLWFARYPNSELPMQALLFAAVLAALRARDGGGHFFAVTAGALLGLTLLLRYEILIAMAAVAAVAVLAPASRQRFGWRFTTALAVSGGIGLWYLLDPMRAYSSYPLGFIRDRGGWLLVAGALVAALAARRLVAIDAIRARVETMLPPALALGLGGLAVYAYVFREAGGRTALGDAIAFRSFGWYLTPPVLLVAVAGTVMLTWRRFWKAPLFFALFAVFSVFFFYKTRIVPEHFWTARRFLGMALPGALLMATGLIPELVNAVASRVAGTGSGLSEGRTRLLTIGLLAVFTVPALLAFWSASAPVARHVEYAGLIPRLEALAARIGDRDLVLVESRNAGSDLHVLAVPLAYIYARHVLVLNSAVPDKRSLETFVGWAERRYARVLFLGGGGTDLLTRHIAAKALGGDRFQVPEYDTPLNRYPTGIHQKEFEYGLYELATAAAVPTGPIDLAIGVMDDLNVVRFHAREVHGTTGTPYRWSRARSLILLPGFPAGARQISISMSSGGRPAAAPPAVVEIALADVRLGSTTPRDVLEPVTVTVPADLAERLAALGDPPALELRVATWNPAALIGGADTRDLGVIVSRVEVR
jgi:hypothetical protein